MEEHELGVLVALRVEVEDVPLQLVLGVAPQPRRTPQRRRLQLGRRVISCNFGKLDSGSPLTNV